MSAFGVEPTPQERADYIVKRLELFIRENREPFKGMRFTDWQKLAHAEICNSLADAEKRRETNNQVSRRFLFTFGSAIATIGFWGTAVAFGKLDYMLAGMVCMIAGIVLLAHAGEWVGRKVIAKHEAKKRDERYRRAVSLDRQIKEMEKQLKKRLKEVEKDLEAIVALKG